MMPTLALSDRLEDDGEECWVRDKLGGDDEEILEAESVAVVDRDVIAALGVLLG